MIENGITTAIKKETNMSEVMLYLEEMIQLGLNTTYEEGLYNHIHYNDYEPEEYYAKYPSKFNRVVARMSKWYNIKF